MAQNPNDLQKAINEFQLQTTQLANEVSHLDTRMKEIPKELAEARTALRELEREDADVRSKLAVKRGELDKLNQQVSQIERSLRSLK